MSSGSWLVFARDNDIVSNNFENIIHRGNVMSHKERLTILRGYRDTHIVGCMTPATNVRGVLALFETVKHQPFVHRGKTWAFAQNWDDAEKEWPELNGWVLPKDHYILSPDNHIRHIFVICSPKHEPEQYAYLSKTLTAENVSFWAPTYGALTAEQMIEFDIQSGLTISEESLEYNFYSLAKFICEMNDPGKFLILESDAILQNTFGDFLASSIDWPEDADAIHIGAGCGDPTIDVAKCDDANYCPMPNTRCTEAIVWTLQGLHKMLERRSISKPVDLEIDLAIQENGLAFYWSKTSHVVQGSKTGVYASTNQKSFCKIETNVPWRIVTIVLGCILGVCLLITCVAFTSRMFARKISVKAPTIH